MKINYHLQEFYKYENELKKVLDLDRYWHSISVGITAVSLSEIYDGNKDEAFLAGILHDYCKCMTINDFKNLISKYNIILTEEDYKAEGCLHGFIGAYVCKELFNINENVFNAIYYHTCGKPAMTDLEKIIFISDFIEPLRRFRNEISEIRKLAFNGNIDNAIVKASISSLSFLKMNNKYIHSNTNKTLEYYKNLLNIKE